MAEFVDCDFLFCNLCGTMLLFDSPQFASCPLCKNQRPAKELEGREIRYTITAEELERHLNLEREKLLDEKEMTIQRSTINEECPKCHYHQLEYYTKQLRSADEGQTVFHECPKCKYKFAVNT